ncbi:MAG: exodeoxyribonuclease VII large subunit, partial [Pseudomonadota bacterium]
MNVDHLMPPGQPSGATPTVLTVSSLNRMARSLLEDGFPSVVVEGEISNLAVPASGHWYLTLKDERAQIRCAMFRGNNRSVRVRPANGMLVTVRGRLSLYEARGDYQLILDRMEEAGAGALQRAFEELKQRLRDEGLFDTERKKPLPARCHHVAIVTSRTGAALQDMLTVFQRRFPLMRITVLPVPVQGDEAPPAIVRALRIANRRRHDLAFDALIVGRGGGSLEDLQAFNEESVARAIAASELPVVSAVGHETDVSIADFAADVRAPTPSAAAELLSPDATALQQRFTQSGQRLASTMQQLLRQRHEQVHTLLRRLR